MYWWDPMEQENQHLDMRWWEIRNMRSKVDIFILMEKILRKSLRRRERGMESSFPSRVPSKLPESPLATLSVLHWSREPAIGSNYGDSVKNWKKPWIFCRWMSLTRTVIWMWDFPVVRKRRLRSCSFWCWNHRWQFWTRQIPVLMWMQSVPYPEVWKNIRRTRMEPSWSSPTAQGFWKHFT